MRTTMNRMKFPKMLIAGMALLLVLAGCTNPESKASTDGSVTLTVPDAKIWGEESSALQVMYDLFTKENPTIKIKQVKMEDYSPALASGKAPDLMLMDPFVAKESYKKNYLEPLDNYYSQHGWDKDMYGWAKNAYSIDGKTIGIPWNYEGLLLVYNDTMFKKNGWKVPVNYNELMALVPKIKEAGIMPFAWGTSDCAGCDNWWMTSIVNSLLGTDGTKQLFSGDKKWTDPDIVEAVQRFSDFWNAGYITDKKSHAVTQEDSTQLLANGKAAMRLDGTWSLASDMKIDFEIGFSAFPSWKPDGSPVIPLGVGGGLVINAKSEHKDEVAKLLTYFFHDDVKKTMAEHGIPEPVEMDYSKLNLKPNVAKALNLISESAAKGETGFVAWSYGSPSVAHVLESDVAAIYLKKTSVEKWLGNLQKQKEKDVKDNNLFSMSNY